MKTLLKSTLVLLTALVVSGQVVAQTNVAANATIVSDLTITNVSDLEFGSVLTSETPTINATDAAAGIVKVAGATTTTSMAVSVTFPDALTDGAPVNDLVFGNYSVAVNASGDDADPTNGVALTGASAVGQAISGTYTSGADAAHIFVGGQITDASAGVAGNDYTNNIVVTVSYE